MKQQNWLEIKMVLNNTPNTVSRIVVIPEYFTLYYVHIIVAQMFHFDDMIDVRIQNEALDVQINEANDASQEGLFMELGDLLKQTEYHHFLYTYYGQDEWQVELIISETDKKYHHIKCIEAKGNAILFEQMTHEVYEKLYYFSKNDQVDAEMLKGIIGNDIHVFNTDLDEANLEELNHKLFLLEGNLLDEEQQLSDYFDETNMNLTDDTENEAEMTIEDFDTNAFLMQLYHEIAGLSEEQAAYEVLYRTNVNEIIAILLEAGYEYDVIDKMLRSEVPFEEHIYNQVQEYLDLLAVLPERIEIFSEDDERFLEEIENIIMNLLDQYQIDLEMIADIDEALEQEFNEKIIQEVEALRVKKLS